MPSPAPDGAAVERRVVPLLRAFTVFNVDQVDGLPDGAGDAGGRARLAGSRWRSPSAS